MIRFINIAGAHIASTLRRMPRDAAEEAELEIETILIQAQEVDNKQGYNDK